MAGSIPVDCEGIQPAWVMVGHLGKGLIKECHEKHFCHPSESAFLCLIIHWSSCMVVSNVCSMSLQHSPNSRSRYIQNAFFIPSPVCCLDGHTAIEFWSQNMRPSRMRCPDGHAWSRWPCRGMCTCEPFLAYHFFSSLSSLRRAY